MREREREHIDVVRVCVCVGRGVDSEGHDRYGARYKIYLICIRATIPGQPVTRLAGENTKFPYSDAPRQKLTLLRFIDPQYCVPSSCTS